MDVMLGLAATVLGLFIVMQAIALIVISARLVKMQLWDQNVAPAAPEDTVPERAVFDAARPILEKEGFRHVETRRMRSFTVSPSMPPSFTDIYWHAEHDVHAEVVVASTPTARRPFDVYLWNTFTDGSAFLTVNGLAHTLIPYPRTVTIGDAYAPNFARQLAAHLAQRANMSQPRTNPADAFALASAMASDLLPALEREGKVYRRSDGDGDPIYSFHLAQALKMAWRMRFGMSRRKRMDAGGSEGGQLPKEAAPEARDAAERITFVRALCSLNGMQAPRWFRWLAFAVSAGGFIALGSWWWGIAAALVIGAVVVVHEAGHWLAMKLANFRDVQVFFIPGMGAATSGEKHDASPLTHLAVYLAGPVPGLVLAVAVSVWLVFGNVDATAWWYATLGMAVVAAFFINLLNLLPVMPLDGGRVIDLFVLGRLPWLRFAFALASGALLFWAGNTLGDNLLRALGLLYFLAIPHQYRMAKVSRELRRQAVSAPLATEDFGQAAARLYDFLSQPAYKQWSHPAKIAVGQAILPRFLGRLPSAKETAYGLVIYIGCIVTPIVALGVLAVADPARIGSLAFGPKASAAPSPAMRHAAEDPITMLRPRRAAVLAAASGPAQRLDALAHAIDDASAVNDEDDILRLARMYHDETAHLPPPARERADAAFRLGDALLDRDGEQDKVQAAKLFGQAESTLRSRLSKQADADDALLLADVLAARLAAGGKGNPLPIRQEIVDLHVAHRAQPGQRLQWARLALARALDQSGQADAAERQLHAAADDLKHQAAPADHARNSLMIDHAWFLIAHQRPQDAVRLLERLMGTVENSSSMDSYFQRDANLIAAMAARMRGDWQEVKARASAIQTSRNAGRGNWLLDTIISLRGRSPSIDPTATLLLVEAERALGGHERANALIGQLRRQYPGKAGGEGRCRFGIQSDPWRAGFSAILANSERRELMCRA